MSFKFGQSDAFEGRLGDRYVHGEALLQLLCPADKHGAEGWGFLW